jgi:hypothetical protein
MLLRNTGPRSSAIASRKLAVELRALHARGRVPAGRARARHGHVRTSGFAPAAGHVALTRTHLRTRHPGGTTLGPFELDDDGTEPGAIIRRKR